MIAAERGAKYWADAMREKAAGDNGASDYPSVAARVMAKRALVEVDPEPFAVRFESELRRLIVETFEGRHITLSLKRRDDVPCIQLATDYGPEGLLRDAAILSEIPAIGAFNLMTCLPWKTCMNLYPDRYEILWRGPGTEVVTF